MATPTNDDIANATRITGLGFTTSGSTAEATGQDGERAFEDFNGPGGAVNSVWFVYNPSEDGTAFFSTEGSNYDTTLVVYSTSATGTPGFAELTLVTANDDLGGPALYSEVNFSADQDLTYLIRVDGYDGSTGNFTLSQSDGPAGLAAAPVCYAAGTLILTERGEVLVEALSEGDLLVTRFGGLRPIRWIGRQTLSGLRTLGQEPVRIEPGALGEGMPRRLLRVSPGHSMLVGETLVLAASLVNGVTIIREAPGDRWEYFQVEFDSHDCVLAEGAWSESFADCRDFRRRFDNAAEFRARFPQHVAPAEPQLCALRPEQGRALEAALRATAVRAAAEAKPGPLTGFVESVATPCRVTGWAADAAHPELPVLLEVVLDDVVIGTALACHRRDDVAASGVASPRAGFFFEGDRLLTTAEQQRLVVRRATDGRVLGEASDPGPLDGHLDRVASPCRLEGWACDPSRPSEPVMLEVVLGTRVLGTVQACRYRKDLADAKLGKVAFVFEAGLGLSAEDMAAIQLRRVGDGALLRRTEATRQAASQANASVLAD